MMKLFFWNRLPALLLLSASLLAGCQSSANAADPAGNTIQPLPSAAVPFQTPATGNSPDPTPDNTPLVWQGNTAIPQELIQAATLDALRSCLSKGGLIELGSLQSTLLPEALDFRVYLPPCYAVQPGRSYPVLYLIHGQSFTDDQWVRLGAAQWEDRQVASGQSAPFIMVMPRDRTWGQPDEDKFGEALIQELIPYIDQHYRTLADRDHRAIGGLSRGGGWAVHLGLEDWQLFGAIAGHSMAIFWADTAYISGWLDAIPAGQTPAIYMDIGNNDQPPITESATWFEGLLTEKKIAHEWHTFFGYHNEEYWGGHIDQYMSFYASLWEDK